MEKEKIAQGNALFLIIAVGMSMGMKNFTQAVFESSIQMSQFPTDSTGYPGYIKIDSTAIRSKGDEAWFSFTEKIMGGFLQSVSYGFSSATKFEGNLAEQVTLKRDGFVFSFCIKQYERDMDHSFEIINPEDLADIPDDEELGRVVYLTISHDHKS